MGRVSRFNVSIRWLSPAENGNHWYGPLFGIVFLVNHLIYTKI